MTPRETEIQRATGVRFSRARQTTLREIGIPIRPRDRRATDARFGRFAQVLPDGVQVSRCGLCTATFETGTASYDAPGAKVEHLREEHGCHVRPMIGPTGVELWEWKR